VKNSLFCQVFLTCLKLRDLIDVTHVFIGFVTHENYTCHWNWKKSLGSLLAPDVDGTADTEVIRVDKHSTKLVGYTTVLS